MLDRGTSRTAMLVVGLLLSAGVLAYWVPKSEPLSVSPMYVGHYRGLGLAGGSGYFGKNWFRIDVNDEPGCSWSVDVHGVGDAPYRGYYDSGVLREEGVCRVDENGSEVLPDRHNLREGKFYDPQGKLVSEVKNGTGKQVLCWPSGHRYWELALVDRKRTHLKWWYENGVLFHDDTYVDGRQQGLSLTYHPNGQLRSRAEYVAGAAVGKSFDYDDSGKLIAEYDHDAPPDK